jgi:ribosomal protein S18 acetylase RimI-like enzyme
MQASSAHAPEPLAAMGDPAIEIRQAQLGDIPRLVELFTAVVAERTWLGTEPGFDPERLRTGWSRRIALEDHLTLVAAGGERIVGTLSLVPAEAEHELAMLVAAGYRGQRIGTKLIAAAVAWSRKQGIAMLGLGVFAHNTAAIRLYQSAGFHEVKRRDAARARQTGEIYDIIEMEVRL